MSVRVSGAGDVDGKAASVFIIAASDVVRAGLVALIEADTRFTIAGSAADFGELTSEGGEGPIPDVGGKAGGAAGRLTPPLNAPSRRPAPHALPRPREHLGLPALPHVGSVAAPPCAFVCTRTDERGRSAPVKMTYPSLSLSNTGVRAGLAR